MARLVLQQDIVNREADLIVSLVNRLHFYPGSASFSSQGTTQETLFKETRVFASEYRAKADSVPKDLKAIVNWLHVLDQLAGKYSKSKDNSKMTQLVLEIVRRSKYSGLMWAVTAGIMDDDFYEVAKKEHPEVIEAFLPKGKGAHLSDPVTGVQIDFIHLAATLNGILFDSHAPWPEGEINDLAGWSGDLQSAIRELQLKAGDDDDYDYDQLHKYAKEIVAAEEGLFSQSDMLADIDSVNLAAMLQANPDLTFAEAMEKYYSEDVHKRYTIFVENSGGWEQLQQGVDGSMSNYGVGPLEVEPYLINKFQISDATENQYRALNQAFMEYIKKQVQWENIAPDDLPVHA